MSDICDQRMQDQIEGGLHQMNEYQERIDELELKLAKSLSKLDTLRCYMCNGGKYFEWVDWDTFDEEYQQKYLDKAKEATK